MKPNATTASLPVAADRLSEAPGPASIATCENALAVSANDTERTSSVAVRSVDALALAMRYSALGG